MLILIAAAVSGAAAFGGDTVSVVMRPQLPALSAEFPEGDFEWSEPMLALGHESETVNALQLEADAKFKALKTRFAAVTDGKTLRVAVVAPAPADIPPKAKGFGGKDDFIEVFLSDPRGGFWQLLVNATGSRMTLYYAGASAGAEQKELSSLETAAGSDAGGFRVMLSVSLAELGIPELKGGEVLRGNVTREGPSCGGVASWANVGAIFTTPERFGEWFVGGREKVVAARKAAAAANEQALAAMGKKLIVWADDTWTASSALAVPDAAKLPMKTLKAKIPGGAKAITSFSLTNRSGRDYMGTIRVKGELAKMLRFREVGCFQSSAGMLVPDPLLELPGGWVVRVPAGKTVKVWTDTTDRTLKPGLHRAEIEVHSAYSYFGHEQFTFELEVSKVAIADEHPRADIWGGGPWALEKLNAEYGVKSVGLTPNYIDDFKAFDGIVARVDALGIPRKDQEYSIWMDFQKESTWSRVKDNRRWAQFGEEAWKTEWTRRLRAFVKHLKDDLGLDYRNFSLFTIDEPHGDPANPKNSAYYAVEGAKFLKSVDPKLRIWTDPYRMDEQWQSVYLELYDRLLPCLPRLRPEKATIALYRAAAAAGKDIGSYSVLTKNTTPNVYRAMSWSHMAYGFEERPTFYDLWRGEGDPFDSFDGGAVKADHGGAYRNRVTDSLIFSVRIEAWYEGLVDLRLYHYAKARVKDEASRRRLAELVEAGFKGTRPFATLRGELLGFCEELSR